MSRMPQAQFRPVVNVHRNGVKEHRGLVLHVQEGLNSPFGWFNNPSSEASSDFWVSKSGLIEQYVETGTDYAWAQAAGNAYYASVETEGHVGEPLTAAQIEGVAKIYAWGHATFGWPLTVVDSTTAHGLTWHGAGGAAWGGHYGCPGTLRKNQRAAIMARATQLAGSGASQIARYQVTINGLAYGYGATGTQVTQVGQALVKHGFGRHYTSGPGPNWTDADTENYADYQRSLGYKGTEADGVPGAASLTKLLGKLPGPTHPATPATPKPAPKPSHPGFPVGIAPNKSNPSAKTLQQLLKDTGWLAKSVPLSDNYGPKTQAAVIGFNKKHGLNSVGKTKDPAIGPKGWALLCTLALG